MGDRLLARLGTDTVEAQRGVSKAHCGGPSGRGAGGPGPVLQEDDVADLHLLPQVRLRRAAPRYQHRLGFPGTGAGNRTGNRGRERRNDGLIYTPA